MVAVCKTGSDLVYSGNRKWAKTKKKPKHFWRYRGGGILVSAGRRHQVVNSHGAPLVVPRRSCDTTAMTGYDAVPVRLTCQGCWRKQRVSKRDGRRQKEGNKNQRPPEEKEVIAGRRSSLKATPFFCLFFSAFLLTDPENTHTHHRLLIFLRLFMNCVSANL